MAARRKKATEPCPECFPDGWEGVDAQHEGVKVAGVGCEHGTYQRDGKSAPTGGSGGGQDGGGSDDGDSGGNGGQGDGETGEGDGK